MMASPSSNVIMQSVFTRNSPNQVLMKKVPVPLPLMIISVRLNPLVCIDIGIWSDDLDLHYDREHQHICPLRVETIYIENIK